MFNIRVYNTKDYDMLKGWFNEAKTEAPPKEMFSEQTTFIIEDNSLPLASITVYVTNCKGMSILEHFIGNPNQKGEIRKKATKELISYCYAFLKNLGFKNVVGFAMNDNLQKYYKDVFGMQSITKNLTSMARGL